MKRLQPADKLTLAELRASAAACRDIVETKKQDLEFWVGLEQSYAHALAKRERDLGDGA